VKTGSMGYAATSAHVYLILTDEKGEERKVWLTTDDYNPESLFDTGSEDVFTIYLDKQLSPIAKLKVGHDNSGGGPGWYLEKVTVR
jgi:hypothetical protein